MFELWILVLFGIGLASWILIVIEMLGTLGFSPGVFRLGPRILLDERPTTKLSLARGDRVDTRSARFRMVAPGLWLFRWKFRLIGMHSAYKGSLTLRDGGVVAESRWPLGMTGFVAAWLLLWCSLGVSMLLEPATPESPWSLETAALVLGGIAALVTALVALSLRRDRRLARRAVDEFLAKSSAEGVN